MDRNLPAGASALNENRRSGVATGMAFALVALAAAGKFSRARRQRLDLALVDQDNPGGRSSPDAGRGRSANAPSELPPRGWLDVARRVQAEVNEDRILSVAAGVTFYALLALFPAIAALVSIYGLFTDPNTIEGHIGLVSGLLPGGAVDIVREQVQRIASSGETSLGTAFFIGLAFSLWSANQGMKAMFDALNVAYGEDEKRGFVRLTAETLLFTLLAIGFVILAMAAVVVVPVVLGYVGLGGALEAALRLGRWPLLLVAIMVALAVLYRYGPSRERARWRWVTWGSGIAAVLWLLVSVLFSWYAANLATYNETYGSLGAVIGFMTWIWLSATVVLLGAEINAELERQTARETTRGPSEPGGRRGARIADRVAAGAGAGR